MRRALQIAVSLMGVALLLGPFDCFAAGATRSRVADCCLKGHCAPSANSDACCKNSVPDRDQSVLSPAAEHSSPLIAIAAAYVPAPTPGSTFGSFAGPALHPPPRIELSTPSLPLLV